MGAIPPIDARTAAYGSAYCIVLLTRGPISGSGKTGGALLDRAFPNPLGAGSENAPYASILGLGAAAVEGLAKAAGGPV